MARLGWDWRWERTHLCGSVHVHVHVCGCVWVCVCLVVFNYFRSNKAIIVTCNSILYKGMRYIYRDSRLGACNYKKN